MLPISALSNTLCGCAFSTLRILPRKDKIACVTRSRPFLAEPPAELPSTIKISHSSGLREEQSANLPGRVVISIPPLRLICSLAFREAIRAFAALTTFSIINFAILGFSNKKRFNPSPKTPETIRRTSEFPSFVFVCPSYCGLGCFTETIALRPSLISSVDKFSSRSFI